MNAERRKEINRALGLIEDAYGILETILEEEKEAFDNLPESLQEGDKGEQMQMAISTLEEWLGYLDAVRSGQIE